MGLRGVRCRSVIILVINKSDSRFAVVRFRNHSYDCRPNRTSISPITYILLTECEDRIGRISARVLGSTDRAASARSIQERPRADILPVRSRANSVNKRFINHTKSRVINYTTFSVRKDENGWQMQRVFSARRLKIKLIALVGFLVQFNQFNQS